MENYDATIIGASTENPFLTLTNAMRSRSFLYEFLPFSYDEMERILNIVLKDIDITLSNEVKDYLIYSSSGDARAMLTLLNFSYKANQEITLATLKELRANVIGDGVSSSSSHYDLASAMIKSLRGSNIDAALYYLARLIDGAEDFLSLFSSFLLYLKLPENTNLFSPKVPVLVSVELFTFVFTTLPDFWSTEVCLDSIADES